MFSANSKCTLQTLDSDTFNIIHSQLSTKDKIILSMINRHFFILKGSLTITKPASITSPEFNSLLNFLKLERCQISALDLSNLDLAVIDEGGQATRFEHLCEILKDEPQIKNLNLHSCNLERIDLTKFTVLIHLDELDISTNQLEAQQIESVSKLDNLKKLNIEYNLLKEAGAKSISSMKNLLWLNIGSNQLGNSGVIHISTMQNLFYLNVWGNYITKAECITYMKKLNTLNISINKINFENIKIFIDLPNIISLNIKLTERKQIEDYIKQIKLLKQHLLITY